MKRLALALCLLAAPPAFAQAAPDAAPAVDAGAIDAGGATVTLSGVIVSKAPALDAGSTAVAIVTGLPDGGIVATIPDPTQDFGAFAQMVYAAVLGSNWKLLAILAVIGLVYLLKRFGGSKIPWLDTDRGGAVLALLVGVAGALCNALAAAKTVTPDLIVSGVLMGITAAGGYSVVKKILFPQDMPASTPTASSDPDATPPTGSPAPSKSA